jgi:beta-fructofuranosidase
VEPGSVFRLGILGSGACSSGAGTEETVIEIRRNAGISGDSFVALDRSRSSLDLSVDSEERSGPVTLPGGRLRLRVLVDRSAVEIFANGKPLTARVYPTLGGTAVRLSAEGAVRLRQLDAWRMEGIFSGPRPLFP